MLSDAVYVQEFERHIPKDTCEGNMHHSETHITVTVGLEWFLWFLQKPPLEIRKKLFNINLRIMYLS